MIKNIMKMGGCKTEAEFYKKYPTEESFLEAFPQGRPMMEQYQIGGVMYVPKKQKGGVAFPQAPTADRFFNYGASYSKHSTIYAGGWSIGIKS